MSWGGGDTFGMSEEKKVKKNRRCPVGTESSDTKHLSQRRFQCEVVPEGHLLRRGRTGYNGVRLQPGPAVRCHGKEHLGKAPGCASRWSAERVKELFVPVVLNPGGGVQRLPAGTLPMSGDVSARLSSAGGLIGAPSGSPVQRTLPHRRALCGPKCRYC